MKEIALYGKYSHLSILVDDEDFEAVAQYRWTHTRNRSGNVYARRSWWEPSSVRGAKGQQKFQNVHNFLTGWSFVDHINHDGLDNRRANLRLANQRLNEWNSRPQTSFKGKACSSRFKGVHRASGGWIARIRVNYQRVYLGTFKSEMDAAAAYDDAARTHFGEWATFNLKGDR